VSPQDVAREWSCEVICAALVPHFTIKPLVEGEPVSEYFERVFSILALAIEEVIMYGF
jgi:hypothetical protein